VLLGPGFGAYSIHSLPLTAHIRQPVTPRARGRGSLALGCSLLGGGLTTLPEFDPLVPYDPPITHRVPLFLFGARLCSGQPGR